jgi:two-component sensor histidine kinase
VAALILFLPLGGLAAEWGTLSFGVAGLLAVVVAAGLADSVRELRRNRAQLTDAQTQLRTLVGELAHRNRNALFVIISIVKQSARSASSAAEAERIINARLEALVRAQEVIVGAEGGGASLRPLIERTLEPFGLERFNIEPSPEAQLAADTAMALGLLFHELSTNAIKHGALSAPAGRVHVGWTLHSGAARLTWRERGGPVVAEPQRKGFGTRLLEGALASQGGKAERRFEPEGLVCELHIPAAAPG